MPSSTLAPGNLVVCNYCARILVCDGNMKLARLANGLIEEAVAGGNEFALKILTLQQTVMDSLSRNMSAVTRYE